MGKTSWYELIVIKAEEKDISDIYQIGTVSFSDAWREETIRTVSYTHLTLPTICSV